MEPAASRPPPQLMRVLVIDEHSLFLSSFGTAILRCATSVSLVNVETAGAAHGVLDDGQRVDVVLLNLQRADGTGFELLAGLRSAHHATPVVVTSGVDTNAEIVRAIYFGATGFVPVGATPHVFLEALQAVSSGRIFMPPMFARSPPSSSYSRAWTGFGTAEGPAWREGSFNEPARSEFVALGLTRRQSDVLGLLMEGQSNKSMARLLNLSVDTIKDHVAGLLRTLNVKSRTQAVIAASRMGDLSKFVERRDRVRRDEASINT
jgi:DNA-binding NarL/FixJ family response regulator